MKPQRSATPSDSDTQGVIDSTTVGNELPSSSLLGEIDVRSIRSLGSGTDHTAFCVNEEVVLRCAKRTGPDTAQRIRHEVAVLDAMSARSPLPVPEVIGADPDGGSVLLRFLAGTALLDATVPDLAHITAQLVPFLIAVHSTSPRDVAVALPTDTTDHVEYLEDATQDLAAISGLLSARKVLKIERFLSDPPPPAPPPETLRLCHNDLGAEHILVSTLSEITGVIDWSDAAITDPARDYGKLMRDLGTDAIRQVLRDPLHEEAGYDFDLADRALFLARCSLLEDLRYGIETGDSRYSDAATARLERIF